MVVLEKSRFSQNMGDGIILQGRDSAQVVVKGCSSCGNTKDGFHARSQAKMTVKRRALLMVTGRAVQCPVVVRASWNTCLNMALQVWSIEVVLH